MNAEFVPNCHDCRDSVGHFCDTPFANGSLLGCASRGALGTFCPNVKHLVVTAELEPNSSAAGASRTGASAAASWCVSTCRQCLPPALSPSAHLPEGWSGDAATMWTLVLLISLLSPVLTWLLLPFLRGEGTMDNRCFGIMSCSGARVRGICGQGASVAHKPVAPLRPDVPQPPPISHDNGVVQQASHSMVANDAGCADSETDTNPLAVQS